MTTKIHIKLSNLNLTISNLISNGFEEYLNTWEKVTAYDDFDMNHVIMTCNKGSYIGWVADIYYNEKDGRCWIQYGKQ